MTPNPNDIQQIDKATKAITTPRTNPLAAPPRTLLTDRLNTLVCSIVIGSPKAINDAAGLPVVYEGFYHQPHRRMWLTGKDWTPELERRLTTAHTFRYLLCKKVSTLLPMGVIGLAVLVSLALAIKF